MNYVENMIEELYEEFVGLPNNKPIVRNNTKEDAFTLAILKIVYGKMLNIEIKASNIEKISKIIVAPPDSGIDLFIEIEDGDEYYYNIIQSKYSVLTENEITNCLAIMERTIKDYLKKPSLVQPNLREVISETNFGDSYKNNCEYYVVHKGEINYGKSIKRNENIVTINELNVLCDSIVNMTDLRDARVPYDEFSSDAISNFLMYEQNGDEDSRALLCNIRGYDLAKLCNKYISTSLGRNILFGQNLRDALSTSKSKTYKDMENTINTEPTRFWHYNNGITIIAESLDLQENENGVDMVKLENFSIINGAQTTSALGTYLKEASINNNEDAINNLKNVYVLARIMEVNDEELRDNISIYNNSQNPISSRDMVSNRYEQRKLNEDLIGGEAPNIYVEIRRGTQLPQHPRFEKHQRTTNEELAQLAFAAFLKEPFNAKDKKKTLFNKDYSNDNILINNYYQKIFNYPGTEEAEKGVLFRKDRKDIDELLFIKYLYKQSKNYLKKYYDKKIDENLEKIEKDESARNSSEMRIESYKRYKEINNTCMFYCITLFYEIKEAFSKEVGTESFDYNAFYRGKDLSYKDDIIQYFANNFLEKTIEIIAQLLAGEGNIANWVRRSRSQDEFLNKLNEEITIGNQLESMYDKFVREFKK